MRAPEVLVLDFETDRIKSRPEYPPKPVGFSLLEPRKKRAEYYAWGHPTKNNCDIATAKRVFRQAWLSGPLLFHHSKFDVDVAVTHMGVPMVPWNMIHDTEYLLFLDDPHQRDLRLKPSAQRILGVAPEERDIVVDWLMQHWQELMANGLITQADIGYTEKGNAKKLTPAAASAFIGMAPGDIVGDYANGDVTRTRGVFNKVYPLIAKRNMLEAYDRERKLMPILLDNETIGLRADENEMRKDQKIYYKAMDTADAWLRKEFKAPDLNVDSDEEVATLLDAQGIVTDWVYTPTGLRSVAKKNLTPDMFIGKRGERIASVLGYRNRLSTCLGTFLDKWLYMAEHSDGYIFTNWNQTRQDGRDGAKGTRTGRLSSNPNFQNVPKDFYDKNDGYVHPKFITSLPELPYMRKYLMGDEGEWFGHRDYNQQEYRILAHYEDSALLEAYNSNPRLDMHEFVKGEIFRLAMMALERRAVKILNFGILYGMGKDKLARDLGVDIDTAVAIKKAHRAAMPGLGGLETLIKRGAKEDVPIRTWGGREYYTEEPIFHKGRWITFEYKLLNYLIQGSAADCTKEAIIRYNDVRKNGRFLVTVHDEINISAPQKAMKQELLILRDVMRSVEFDVPMISDAKMGRTWGTLEKVKEAA